jgi:hypothetical protein
MVDFSNVPRGQPLRGARAIAEAIFGDERRSSIYRIDREAFGIVMLSGQLIAYEGWIAAALAERAASGERRRHRRSQSNAA